MSARRRHPRGGPRERPAARAAPGRPVVPVGRGLGRAVRRGRPRRRGPRGRGRGPRRGRPGGLPRRRPRRLDGPRGGGERGARRVAARARPTSTSWCAGPSWASPRTGRSGCPRAGSAPARPRSSPSTSPSSSTGRPSSGRCTRRTPGSGLGSEGFGVFVAGPSKTADIEQSLVVGAHGPLSLTVVLVGSGPDGVAERGPRPNAPSGRCPTPSASAPAWGPSQDGGVRLPRLLPFLRAATVSLTSRAPPRNARPPHPLRPPRGRRSPAGGPRRSPRWRRPPA